MPEQFAYDRETGALESQGYGDTWVPPTRSVWDVTPALRQWADTYHEFIETVKQGDSAMEAQVLMNESRHAWMDLNETERWAAWPWYTNVYLNERK